MNRKEYQETLAAFNDLRRAISRLDMHLIMHQYICDGSMRSQIKKMEVSAAKCQDVFETQNKHLRGV